MPQRACEGCGEMVDAAKAFCPQCGHALVEERQRTDESEFQKMDGTMQLGKTMYNQMLSDMGLNLKAKGPAGKQQAIRAIEPTPQPDPAATIPPAKPIPETTSEKRSRNLFLFGIIAAFLILGLLIAVAAGVMIWSLSG